MDEILSNLKIEAETKETTVRRGEMTGNNIGFNVLYKNMPAAGIPVEFFYTGGYLKNDRQMTDSKGLVFLQPETVFSKNKQEQLSAKINVAEIAAKATDDTFIRGLILKKSMQPGLILINIESPTLSLRVAENCCQGDECLRLNKIFIQNALNAGYLFLENNPTDYIFNLSYQINQGTSAGGFMSVDLKGDLKLTDKTNRTIWTKEITGIRGVGGTVQEAREKAYNEFNSALDRNYIRQGFDKIMTGY
jgi:hypothetical protein